MNGTLFAGAILLFLGGLSHSIAGEMLIFRKLAHEHLPELRGNTQLTAKLLSVSWHFVTIIWWSLAGQFLATAQDASNPMLWKLGVLHTAALAVSAVYLTTATRGRFRPVAVLWAVVLILTAGFLATS